MTTFELEEVRQFATDLEVRMNECDDGEGMFCTTIDETLQHYAKLCCEFCEQVQLWDRAVFTGQVAFDEEIDQVFLKEADQLYRRASEMAKYGPGVEEQCGILDGNAAIRAALWKLFQLLNPWQSPKLARSPAARLLKTLDSSAIEEARRRVDSLPPLPSDWQPDLLRQRLMF